MLVPEKLLNQPIQAHYSMGGLVRDHWDPATSLIELLLQVPSVAEIPLYIYTLCIHVYINVTPTPPHNIYVLYDCRDYTKEAGASTTPATKVSSQDCRGEGEASKTTPWQPVTQVGKRDGSVYNATCRLAAETEQEREQHLRQLSDKPFLPFTTVALPCSPTMLSIHLVQMVYSVVSCWTSYAIIVVPITKQEHM